MREFEHKEIGFVCGAFCSLFNPYFLNNTLAGIKVQEKLDKEGYHLAKNNILRMRYAIVGYTTGATLIIGNIIRAPENPINYLPLAANLASVVAKFYFKQNSEKLEQRVK